MKKQLNSVFEALPGMLQRFVSCTTELNEKFYKRCEKLANFSPYTRLLRLNNPVAFVLLLAPTWWAIAFSTKSYLQMIWLFFIFGLGAIVMRSAGCIINDLADHKLDKLVARTKSRPLASGEISKKSALFILSLLLLIAFGILMLLPNLALKIGLFSIIPIIIYPFSKRFIFFPQVVLGFTFNLGVLIAWVSAAGELSWRAFLVYIAAALWTTGYDAIYAYQDVKDDIHIGIKSMAVKLQEKGPNVIWVIYQITFCLICIAGLNTYMNLPFYLVMAVAGYHLYWQIETLDIEDSEDCSKKFRSNAEFALLVLLAILIGKT